MPAGNDQLRRRAVASDSKGQRRSACSTHLFCCCIKNCLILWCMPHTSTHTPNTYTHACIHMFSAIDLQINKILQIAMQINKWRTRQKQKKQNCDSININICLYACVQVLHTCPYKCTYVCTDTCICMYVCIKVVSIGFKAAQNKAAEKQ